MSDSDLTITWIDSARRCSLKARLPENIPLNFSGFEIETKLQEISEWCEINGCGRRMSYDIFQFKTKKDLSLFLLRWQNCKLP